MSTNQTKDQKLVDFIQVTGVIMEKTAALVKTKEAQDKMLSKLIPQAVQALIDNERIEPHEKEAAVKLLEDPVKVMEILIKTASHRNDAERAALGKPYDGKTKKASSKEYNSLEDNYVGRRSRPGEAESDKAFKRGLGYYG